VRDGITLAKLGHPAVVFVHDNFERAARAQAAMLGVPDLEICVYPQFKPGDPPSGEPDKAARAAVDFQSLLTGPGNAA
jgi:hypothetical protein